MRVSDGIIMSSKATKSFPCTQIEFSIFKVSINLQFVVLLNFYSPKEFFFVFLA